MPDSDLPTDQYNRQLYRMYGSTNLEDIRKKQNYNLFASNFDPIKAENFQKKSIEEQQKLINISEKAGGILDIFLDDNPEKRLEQAKAFFETPGDEAAVILATLLNGGKEVKSIKERYEEVGTFSYDAGDYTVTYRPGSGGFGSGIASGARTTPGVTITHKESGLTERIELEITPDVTEYFFDQKKDRDIKIKENREKLFNFISSTITEEAVDEVKSYNKEILGDFQEIYEKEIKVTTTQKQSIQDDINVISFEPYEKEKVDTDEFGVTQVLYTETIQPYKTELEQAKNQLIQQGNENPTKKEIEEKTREIIFKDKLLEQRTQNATDFYNSIEEEGSRLAMYKYASFLQGKLAEQNLEDFIIKQNVYHQYREDFIKEQQPGGSHNKAEAFIEIYESKEKVNISPHHYEMFGVKDPSKMSERQRLQVPMVTLKNGTTMPKAMFDKGNELFEKK